MVLIHNKGNKPTTSGRKQGGKPFVIVSGAISWGIPAAIMWTLLMWFFSPSFNPVVGLPIALVLFPCAGLAWAGLLLRLARKRGSTHHTQDQD